MKAWQASDHLDRLSLDVFVSLSQKRKDTKRNT